MGTTSFYDGASESAHDQLVGGLRNSAFVAHTFEAEDLSCFHPRRCTRRRAGSGRRSPAALRCAPSARLRRQSENRAPGRFADMATDDVPLVPRSASSPPPSRRRRRDYITVTSAPDLTRISSFARSTTYTIVRAPLAAPRCESRLSTHGRLPRPQAGTHSPSCRWARVTSIRYALEHDGNAASCSKEAPLGE